MNRKTLDSFCEKGIVGLVLAALVFSALAPGAVLAGPAMIVEPTTTTFVTERFSASVDGGGALILTANGAS